MSKRKLTRQQQRRLAELHEQQRLLPEDSLAELQEGVVTARYGAKITLQDNEGEMWLCHQRQYLGDLVAGDKVRWQIQDEHHGVIVAQLPRSSELMHEDKRGVLKCVAANITQLCIVCAPLPQPNLLLIDQYLMAARIQGFKSLLIVNKMDLASDNTMINALITLYQQLDVKVITMSALNHVDVPMLQQVMCQEVNVFVGQSGVGKSTLVQSLLPEEMIRTGELGLQSQLGKHTTSTARYYPLLNGGALIDSPGVRDFSLPPLTDSDVIQRGFIEFSRLEARCQFRNCRHVNPKGCAILAAVEQGQMAESRLQSLRYFLDLMDKHKEF